MAREQTPDAALISGLVKHVSLDQLIELYNKTDRTLSHYNGKGVTAFLVAVGVRNHQFINYLFTQQPNRKKEWLSQFTKAGHSPLHILAEKAFDENGLMTAKLILDNGAEIDTLSKDINPITPLYLATASRNSLIVPLYVERGANIYFRGKEPHNQTPVDLSCIKLPSHVENAAQSALRESFLLAACKNNDTATVEALLTAGTNPNIKDAETGFTPLHIAAGLKNLRCIELLLGSSIKPDINSIDNNGGTPLVAAMTRRPYDDEIIIEITHTLIKNGANIFHKTKGESGDVVCLEYMAKYCKRGVFEAIDPKIIQQYRTNDGLSLLHLAANANNLGTTNGISGPIGLFKDILGVDIRCENNGPTALELATSNSRASTVFLLLEYGANPLLEVPGKKGTHAYAYAKSAHNDNPEKAKIIELIDDKLGNKREKENVSQAAKPAVPNNLHMRLPTAPACKAVGKTPTLYQPLPAGKGDDIYVSARLRAGQGQSAAATLPPPARTVTAGGPVSQRPK